MECKKCGKTIEEDWKYCNFCGANLEELEKNNLDDKEIKQSFFNTYKFLINTTIISILLSIFVYFFKIDIIYHLEYGDVSDFFYVLFNVVKIIIMNIFIIGISALIIKNCSNEKIYKYGITSIGIILCLCFSSSFNNKIFDTSNQTTDNSEYTYKKSTTSSSTNNNYSKYCEIPSCAREKEPGYSYCDKHLEDPNWQPSYTPSSSSSSTYSNYHKCEYYECTNYASGTKYCSVHNQTKCSKIGCSEKEAYQGAGLCKEHLYEEILKYGY